MKCPFPGCNGQGHVNSNRNTHRSRSGCPLAAAARLSKEKSAPGSSNTSVSDRSIRSTPIAKKVNITVSGIQRTNTIIKSEPRGSGNESFATSQSAGVSYPILASGVNLLTAAASRPGLGKVTGQSGQQADSNDASDNVFEMDSEKKQTPQSAAYLPDGQSSGRSDNFSSRYVI